MVSKEELFGYLRTARSKATGKSELTRCVLLLAPLLLSSFFSRLARLALCSNDT